MIAMSSSTLLSIAVPALIVLTALIFPIAQRRGASIFRPRTSSVVAPGFPDEWLQQCCDVLETTRHFSVVEVTEYDHWVQAKYRRPPVWADLKVEFVREEEGTTRINATVSVLPNLLTLAFSSEWRVLGRFARAIGAPSEPHPRARVLR
jgi:hypothetical protein